MVCISGRCRVINLVSEHKPHRREDQENQTESGKISHRHNKLFGITCEVVVCHDVPFS
jgi:hypothetical protein